MSVFISADSSPRHHLLKATFFSALVAVVVLVLAVLPAEYGLDPTGIGTRLGLTRLADAAEAAEPAAAAAEPVGVRSAGNAALAEKAGTAFGASAQQAFAAEAVSFATTPLKTDSMDVTLPPGKGVEVKTLLAAGDGFVYRWSADGDVAVDMHGERTGVKGAWTSYAVESAQRENAGTFVAPFEGSHGWYWHNRGSTPVTLHVQVTGFQSALYQP